MIKIAHFADIHIHNNKRHDEYRKIFENIYGELNKIKPNIITIVGDLFEDYIELSNEAKILSGEFLNTLTKYSDEIIIVAGNHDLRKKNLKRINSVETIVKLINNPKIKYYPNSGFFDDDKFNIVWVNYSHLEKNIIPDYSTIVKQDKYYIGLFHDPVYGCIGDNNLSMNNNILKNSSLFKNNDLTLLGDIHLPQFITKNIAYSGSLIQQDFGEKSHGHGFILWNLDDKITSKFIVVDNPHNFVNLYVNEETDYDNLNLTDTYITSQSSIKVNWKDLNANVNNENEKKIKDYIIKKYNITDIRFEKVRIYNNIISSGLITESIDINNHEIQQNIIKEYLKLSKYDDKTITKILDLDNLITDRLTITKSEAITWNLDKLWVNNFKSYSEFDINWKDINGIIQLQGLNQQGKSTIIDSINYCLYGTILGLDSKEKFKDNVFINNKRDLNFCEAGAIITANGITFTIIRKTVREINKKGEIKSVSTTVEYYKGNEIKEENKLTEETKSETQYLLNKVLGDFKSFIQLTVINSDNLNDILSIDRATFIDSILKDAGFEIYEQKLNEFKEYKKELVEENGKITLNITDAENIIIVAKAVIENNNNDITLLNNDLTKIQKTIEVKQKEKEDHIKRLHKIDETLNIDDLNDKITFNNNKIEKCNYDIETNSTKINDLKDYYDDNKLKSNIVTISKIKDENSGLKLKSSSLDNDINTENNNIEKITEKILQLKRDEISKLNNDIKSSNDKIENYDEDISDLISSEKSKLKLEEAKLIGNINVLKSEISNIKENGNNKKKEIDELEKSKTCPTCNRSYDEDTLHNIDNKKEELKKDLTILFDKAKAKQTEIDNLVKSNTYKDKIKNLDNNILDGFKELSEKIKIIKSNIDIEKSNIENVKKDMQNINDGIYSEELTVKINKGQDLLNNANKKIKEIEDKKDKLSETILLNNENLSNLDKDNKALEQDKDQYEEREKLISLNDKISLDISKYKFEIEKVNLDISKYNLQKNFLEQNNNIKKLIDNIEIEIGNLNKELKTIQESINNLNTDNTIQAKDIDKTISEISKVKEQIKKDELHKLYEKIIHRDGIPTYLLLKNIDIINSEINSLLSEQDFCMYFDENLKLKFYHHIKPAALINAVLTSGKERTFCALALKIALRKINQKSKPDFLCLDEMTGKLIDNSISEFINFLKNVKKIVNKIIIIEHNHEVYPDMVLEVKKDKKGISTLSMY